MFRLFNSAKSECIQQSLADMLVVSIRKPIDQNGFVIMLSNNCIIVKRIEWNFSSYFFNQQMKLETHKFQIDWKKMQHYEIKLYACKSSDN